MEKRIFYKFPNLSCLKSIVFHLVCWTLLKKVNLCTFVSHNDGYKNCETTKPIKIFILIYIGKSIRRSGKNRDGRVSSLKIPSMQWSISGEINYEVKSILWRKKLAEDKPLEMIIVKTLLKLRRVVAEVKEFFSNQWSCLSQIITVSRKLSACCSLKL